MGRKTKKELTAVKINYRTIIKEGVVIAVFYNRLPNGKYQYYDLYGGDHGELTEDFIRTETKQANGYNVNELNQYLIRRGYENIIVKYSMRYNQ